MEESRPLKRALINDVVGAIFGSISRRVISPSDVTKIRFQVQLEPTSSWALLCSSKAENHIHSSPYLSYLSGALVGCATTVRSYPFHLLRTILSGLSRTLVKIIPYAGLQFGTYDTFKRWTLQLNRLGSSNQGLKLTSESLSSFQLFACGLDSGTCAEDVCHTLDVVKNGFHVIGHRIVDFDN
ncbi:hypothetical protein MKW92_000800 [Papaver armeniacum]|nr:hypothetical protein MKW92_000800 [Papaver armeniacum]